MGKEYQAILREFHEIANELDNPYIAEWKAGGNRVMGYLYSYIPEEIFTAAHMMPFHIRGTGSQGTELSDARFTQVNCSFAKHCLNQVLEGKLDFLDGVVTYDPCDHVQRLFDNWYALRKPSFSHIVNVPKKQGNAQTALYTQELEELVRKLEKSFDIQITDKDLAEAIRLHNEVRDLQKKVSDLRRAECPPVTGEEMLAVMVAGMSMPKQIYKEKLEKLLESLDGVSGENKPKARLMLIGGELDETELLSAIESQGGMVVADSLYYGTRSMWKPVNETEKPIHALAEYYLNERPVDPRIFGTGEERKAFYLEIAKTYAVDGVICVRYPFCDRWSFEQDNVGWFFEESGLPTLRLDCEYIQGTTGQMKTRVQAFIESILEV